jgi:hypothetical protein
MTDNKNPTAKGKSFEPGPCDFCTLVLSFASAALYYMGLAPLEGRAKPEKNLVLAKQNIDILDLLHEKTKGNLTEDETKLVEQVTGDLHLKYLEAAKG